MDSLEVLGSKPRLELLRLLSRQDMYVSELMEEVGMDGKTATHHLDVLTEPACSTPTRRADAGTTRWFGRSVWRSPRRRTAGSSPGSRIPGEDGVY